MPPERVLIAHQATIPSYRVAFFRELERLRPASWEFTAVYDPRAARRQRFPPIDADELGFPTLEVREWRFGPGRGLLYQPFLRAAADYDLVIVGDELHNLSYGLAHLRQLVGKPVARWGHGRDTDAHRPGPVKRLTEGARFALARRASGYFAYTDSVRDFLRAKGVDPGRIHTVYNTIDLERERRRYRRLVGSVEQPAGGGARLLWVGRLRACKQPDFLAEAFAELVKIRPDARLTVVGAGDPGALGALRERLGPEAVELAGPLPDDSERLGRLLLASDLFVFPGTVGLGVLHALAWSLTPAVVDSPRQNPEFDYLSEDNALVCPTGTTPAGYARAIDELLRDPERRERCRARAWPSVRQLTVENMARRFIAGVDRLLAVAAGRRTVTVGKPAPRPAAAASGGAFRGPLFVIGMPRSGTKLMRAILNRHSRIALSVAESQVIPYFVRRYGRSPSFDRAGLRRLADELADSVFLDTARRAGRDFDAEEFVAAVDPASWPSIFEYVLRAAAPDKDPGSTVWGDKTPGYLRHTPLLAEVFPGARFVHVVRDPRDCALSVRKSFGKSLYRGAERWARAVTAAQRDAHAPGAEYLVIRYEDLLAKAESTLGRVCGFLGLGFEPSMLDIGMSPEDMGDTRGRTGIVTDNVGKYRHDLSRTEIRRVEEIVCEAARPLGYAIAPEIRRRPLAPAARALYKLTDGWATLRHHARQTAGAGSGLGRAVRHYVTSSWR